MKRLSEIAFWATFTLATLIALGVAVWVIVVGLPFKKAYVSVKADVDTPYRIRAIDQSPAPCVDEILAGWRCRDEDTNAVTLACSRMGLRPSVRNWIDQFNAPLPEFSWLRLHKMANAGTFGVIKRSYREFSCDNTFYVSRDWSRAMLWQEFPKSVCVFEDQTNVVRCAYYTER